MLTGTIVTIFGFVPIGFAKSDAGEYTYSLFAVVAMALLISWFVAVLFAPLIGVKILKEKPEHHEDRKSKIAILFHDLLLFTMRRPKATVFLTVAVFDLALAAWPLVPSQFFPASDRPELLVNMTLRQGVSIDATIEVAKRFDDLLKNDADIDHWSVYIGRGAIRFYLPLDEQLENDFFAQAVVVTKNAEAREHVRVRLQKALDNQFPELVAGLFSFELGPPIGWPVQYRVSGKDPSKVRTSRRRSPRSWRPPLICTTSTLVVGPAGPSHSLMVNMIGLSFLSFGEEFQPLVKRQGDTWGFLFLTDNLLLLFH